MIVVIGAGITGLAAAFELAERGVEFVVLEASDRSGGLIFTEHVDGFTIDAGPDSMLVMKPAAIQLCEELGLGPHLISTHPPRTAFVVRGHDLFPLPSPSILGIPTTWLGIARYDLLPPLARARLALEPFIPRAAARSDESVASFFRRRFGPASVDLIGQPLLGGIHAGDVESLSIRSLFPRLVDGEAHHGSVIRAYRRTRANVAEGFFRSLGSGMGELVQAIERRLPPGVIHFGSAASSIERRNDQGWRVRSGERSIDASAVILATPAFVSAKLLEPIDARAAALCREVPYVSTASVALAWPRASVAHPLEGSGFVVSRAHSDLRITACTWVSSKWESRAPAGMALIRAFIGGAHDPRAARMEDRDLIDIAVRDLSAVIGVSGPPAIARVYRWLDAGAQHNVGHLARVAQIEQTLSSMPGLQLAGSGFRSIGIPDCVADGRAAAVNAVHAAKLLPGSGGRGPGSGGSPLPGPRNDLGPRFPVPGPG
jgi:protoporphyrinogen/coproporphyrinogen III oxidase